MKYPDKKFFIRIFLMILVPFLGFVCFATLFILSNLKTLENADTLLSIVNILEASSEFMHQIQRERGKTVLFQENRFSLAELEEQYSHTDRVGVLLQRAFKWEGVPPEILEELSLFHPRIREIRAQAASGASRLEDYTRIITRLERLEAILIGRFGNPGVGIALQNVLLVESAREFIGRLRGNLVPILSHNAPLTPGELFTVLHNYSVVEPILEPAILHFDEAEMGSFAKMRERPHWKFLNLVIRKVLESSDVGNFGIDPTQAFTASTKVIDDLEGVVRSQIEVVRALQTEIQRESGRMIRRSVAALVVVFFYLAYLGTWYVRDLREKTVSEATVTRLSRLQELILTAAGEGILGLDKVGRVTFVNLAAMKMLGWGKDEGVGKLFHGIRAECKADTPTCTWESCPVFLTLHKGIANRFDDAVFIRSDGSRLETEYVLTPIKEGSEIIGAVVVFSDITARKHYEAELKATRDDIINLREQELNIGFEIQRSLLLGQTPLRQRGVKIASLTIPSLVIDGDFFDFFPLGRTTFDLIFGDVMGKGIPAALVGAAVKSQFQRAMARLLLRSKNGIPPSPEEIVSRVHAEMTVPLGAVERFVSLHYSRFDIEKRELHLVNAGHTPLIQFSSAQGITILHDPENTAIGINERETYHQKSIRFGTGDLFLFYSDGMMDARNPAGAFFGLDRIRRLVEGNFRQEPRVMLAKLIDEVKSFTQSNSFADDATCIALQITG